MRSVTSSRVMGLRYATSATALASASERFMVSPGSLHLLEDRRAGRGRNLFPGREARPHDVGRIVVRRLPAASFLDRPRAAHQEIDEVVADQIVVRMVMDFLAR